MRDVEAELGHAGEQRRRGRRPARRHRDGVVGGTGVGPRSVRQAGQHGRCSGQVGDPLVPDRLPDALRVDLAQGDVGRPGCGDRPREAPAVAVEHRQRPEVRGARVQPGLRGHRERLQVGAAVGVHDALGTTGRAAGVVERQQRQLVLHRHPQRRGTGQQGLVLVLGSPDDHQPDVAAELGEQGPGEVDEVLVDQEDPGAGVADDVGQLSGAQPGVERVEHRPGPRHPEVRLQGEPGVGRQHRDPVPRLHAEAGQRAGQALAPLGELLVGPADRAVHQGGPVAVHDAGPVEEGRRGQCHRAEGGLRCGAGPGHGRHAARRDRRQSRLSPTGGTAGTHRSRPGRGARRS